jgi:TP901 family phage tail tape measure protein
VATLSSKLILSLVDRVSGPSRGIAGSLTRLNGQIARMNAANRSVVAPMAGFASRLLMYAGAYIGVTQGVESTIGAARNMQAQLTEVGIKAGLSGAQIDRLRQQVLQLSPATNQTTTDLLAGVDTMVGLGLSAEQAAAAIPAIGKAATATGASMADLSAAAVAAMQNLKIGPEEMARTLDVMAAAGNAGAFELRDMATYIPSLAASYQGLGQTGVSAMTDLASALQIVRQGTGDSSSAATNLQNILQKVNAPQTRKAFKKMGVNLEKEMTKASKKGMTPIEAIADITDKTLKGDLSKLGDLFQDAQVQQGLRPLIQQLDEYRKLREEVAASTGAVDEAYARRMKNADERLKALQIRIKNAGTVIGANLLEPLAQVADYFSNIFDTSDKRVTIFDQIKAAMDGFAGGLGFKGGAEALQALGDAIFGVAGPDGVAAGEQLGRIAARFREFGETIRGMYDAVANSPLGPFFGSISGYGAGLALTAIGIGLFAGAVRSLAGALFLLSGAKAAVGILKTLGKGGRWLANAATIADGAAEVAGGGNGKPKSKHPGGANNPTPAVGGRGGWLKAMGLTSVMAMWATLVQGLGDTPGDTFEDMVANQAKDRGALQRLLGIDPDGPPAEQPGAGPSARGRKHKREPVEPFKDDDGIAQRIKRFLFGVAADPDFDAREHFRIERGTPSATPAPQGGAGGTIQNMLNGMDKPVSQAPSPSEYADAMRAVTMQTRSTGVSDVNVTNPPPPVMAPITVNQNITMEQAPAAAAKAVADATGASVQAAVEGSLGGGYA